jgi:23S rRNA (uracil1939-C5)-methyltransferase
MRENKISAYDETTGKGLVRHVLIRKGFTSGEIMVCLVISPQEDPGSSERREKPKRNQNRGETCTPPEYLQGQEKFLEKMRESPGMTSVSVSINREKTNVIMGKEIHTLWGSDTISDTIHVRDMQKKGYPCTGRELTFRISPLSFYQVNPVQTEKLYSLALEYAGLTGKETVWDLYCGIGTISLFLAGSAKKIYGVEIIPEAIRDARENAERNGLKNAEFFVGKAEEVLPAFYEGQMREKSDAEMLHPDCIVVDPPRKGCDEACLSTMIKMQPSRIVYVSCDSATLARDLRYLCNNGYEITKIRGVDQFAQTVHVETVCLLSHRISKPDSYVRLSLDMEDYYKIKEKGDGSV